MCLEAIPKLQRKKKQNLKRAYFIYKLKGGRKSKRKQPKQLWQSNSITEASKSKIVMYSYYNRLTPKSFQPNKTHAPNKVRLELLKPVVRQKCPIIYKMSKVVAMILAKK